MFTYVYTVEESGMVIVETGNSVYVVEEMYILILTPKDNLYFLFRVYEWSLQVHILQGIYLSLFYSNHKNPTKHHHSVA